MAIQMGFKNSSNKTNSNKSPILLGGFILAIIIALNHRTNEEQRLPQSIKNHNTQSADVKIREDLTLQTNNFSDEGSDLKSNEADKQNPANEKEQNQNQENAIVVERNQGEIANTAENQEQKEDPTDSNEITSAIAQDIPEVFTDFKELKHFDQNQFTELDQMIDALSQEDASMRN